MIAFEERIQLARECIDRAVGYHSDSDRKERIRTMDALRNAERHLREARELARKQTGAMRL